MIPADDILGELFHGCAFAAFVEQARLQQDWPDVEATRVKAFRYYDEALAEKNSRKTAAAISCRPIFDNGPQTR